MADTDNTLLDQLKNDSILNNVDDIIDQLRTDQTVEDETPQPLNLNEEELGKFILEHGGRVIQESTALVTRLKKTVGASGDAEQVSAFADLVSSTSAAIESLNKIYTQNKKIKAAKELKEQEIEGKKEIAKIKTGGPNGQSGLVIANREEIFNLLLQGRKPDVVDAELDDVSDVEQTMEIQDKDPLGSA